VKKDLPGNGIETDVDQPIPALPREVKKDLPGNGIETHSAPASSPPL
jgi:hypothetical protein